MERDSKQVIGLQVRMKESLRRKLHDAAADRGVSMNAELVARLERSFDNDAALGGAEVAHIARMMAAAFVRGGQLGAARSGHPEWTPAEWMNHDVAYGVARHAVAAALEAMQPERFTSREVDAERKRIAEGTHEVMLKVIAHQSLQDEGDAE